MLQACEFQYLLIAKPSGLKYIYVIYEKCIPDSNLTCVVPQSLVFLLGALMY